MAQRIGVGRRKPWICKENLNREALRQLAQDAYARRLLGSLRLNIKVIQTGCAFLPYALSTDGG
jgi:hypothetical protein